MNECGGRTAKNIMPLPTLSGEESIKMLTDDNITIYIKYNDKTSTDVA